MTGHNIAYIRVSSADQNPDRQLADTGITFDKVFTEKVSGTTRKRPQLDACILHCREGDTLHVHSIDRLARNSKDLQHLIEVLTRDGVVVKFHKENLTFGDQTDPLQDLLFQMLAAFAQFEHAMIRERQREGIAAAKKKGKRIGAPRALTDEQEDEIRKTKQEQPHFPIAQLARQYGVSRRKIYNVLEAA